MRVLHVIPSLKTGGAQKLISELLPALQRLGVECDVLVYRQAHSIFESMLMRKGVKVMNVGSKSDRGRRVIPSIRMQMMKYDLVHAHLNPSVWQTAIAAHGLDIPIVMTEHPVATNGRSNWSRWFDKIIYSKYSRIITVSDSARSDLQSWLDRSDDCASHIVTIPNGVDLRPLRSARRAPGFGTENSAAIMVSDFTHIEDILTVLNALPMVADTAMRLAFVGTGPKLEQSRRLAEALDLRNRVEFLGERDDLPSLISASTLGIQSSSHEGSGISTMEFMAAGKPMIVADIPSLNKIVGPGGMTFIPGDSASLAGQMNRLLLNPELYREMSATCLDRSECFAIEHTAETLRRVYSEVLSEC